MKATGRSSRLFVKLTGASLVLSAVFMWAAVTARPAQAGWLWGSRHHCHNCSDGQGYGSPGPMVDMDGGTWAWSGSPEQERRVVMTIFNRHCIRCHGVDGRGVWDIPNVPDFSNPRWQETRPEGYRARVILEGRGAVMPAFRGTLTLEEACAVARYLYTFVPGTEASRPDLSTPTSRPASPTGTVAPPRAVQAPAPSPVAPRSTAGSAAGVTR